MHKLANQFQAFFGNLNPSVTFEQVAAREYASIKSLIEDRNGAAKDLAPYCFLQGSYKQATAIHAINDIDIVALCELSHPANEGTPTNGPGWNRDLIFQTIANSIAAENQYRNKIEYRSSSMCVKVNLSIKVEILPVVYKRGNNDAAKEPFRLFRPHKNIWEDGYAREHQALLSQKNNRCQGNFIPMIKVLKHIRSIHKLEGVSFYLECLLYNVPDLLFYSGPVTYIPNVLNWIATRDTVNFYRSGLLTPKGERNLFTEAEWAFQKWNSFRSAMAQASQIAKRATTTIFETDAIASWQSLLSNNYFPR